MMMKPKIFFIGFNKCGTKTFHSFFEKNGLRSAHHAVRGLFGRKRFLALEMENNVQAGRLVLRGLDGHHVYSDLIYLTRYRAIEAVKYYALLAEQHPDAFFVLNDRPVEDWIRSRKSHVGGPYGDFAERYAQAIQVDPAHLSDVWQMQYRHHCAEVLRYFEGHERFLHFPLLNKGVADLVRFLKPEYDLDETLWKHRGGVAERAKIHAKKHGS